MKSTHPSFRKMVLVDEDFFATQLERQTSSPATVPSISPSESATHRPLTVAQDDRPIAPVETLPPTPLPTKQSAANLAARQSIKTHPVARSFTPGHAPKVLRLY